MRKLETGSNVSAARLEAIARLLKVDVAYFFDRDDWRYTASGAVGESFPFPARASRKRTAR
jgi:hypothetical protein